MTKQEIENGHIFGSQQTISKILSLNFPIVTLYKIKKFKKVYLKELEDIQESRMEIFKKYGTLDEKTKNYSVNPEDNETYQKFINETTELMKEKTEIDNFEIKLSMFKNTQLSVNDLEVLEVFFDNDLDEKEGI